MLMDDDREQILKTLSAMEKEISEVRKLLAWPPEQPILPPPIDHI